MGVFTERSDKKGKCIRQVIGDKPQSWAPEWLPYSIIGDSAWKNYSVTVDVYIENEGQAGIVGHVTGTGEGYGSKPNGYYTTLSSTGECALYVSTQRENIIPGTLLASGHAANIAANQWHTLTMSFADSTIVVYVDTVQVLKATSAKFTHGMAGLLTGNTKDNTYTTAQFDNLIISDVSGVKPEPRRLPKNGKSIYAK
jgi:galactosylceramidase